MDKTFKKSFKNMAKHNEDETENAISAALLHLSSFVNWLMMTKVL